MSAQQPPVLVGIDGSHDGLIALTWAARYAVLHRAPLRAVYVVDDQCQLPDGPEHNGTEVLDHARRELERGGFAPASLEVRHGHPENVLLELSKSSQALVVGRRGLGGFAELVLGSTTQACAALSTEVPLIVVPDTWQPDAAPYGRIVVGVDGSLEGQDALRFAFEIADATHAALHGVHAVEVRESYPARELPPVDDILARSLDSWRQKYPEVAVEQRGVADHPVRVLAQESASADLVVTGGLGHTDFSELRLGPVARGLLHHSHCPVAVIHHAAH